MLNLIPISMSNLQVIAHFLLIGDVVLILVLFFSYLGSILRYIIGLALMTIVISFVIFLLTNNQNLAMFEGAKKTLEDIWHKLKTGGDL